MSNDFDLIIRGGLVVDGSGSEPYVADVAVRDDRIAAIGRIEGTAPEEIDASGRIVTPGFVDIHTHYDGQAIWSNRLSPSSSHGVTTVVMGNCGVGFAPCRANDHELLIKVMEGVEDIPGVVMAEGLPWNWETFPQYLDALDAHPRDIDVAAYLPHSPLRVYVMGERGANREAATADDLARMRELTREAVKAGALGIASSRMFIHRTKAGELIPSFDAAQAELREIASGLSDAGAGIIQLVLDVPHQSWDHEFDQLVELARATGRPATFTLGQANSGPPTHLDVLAMVERANDEGVQITAQVFPRPIGMIIGHELSVNPFSLCPSYLALANLPFDEKMAELRKPEVRARIIAEEPSKDHPFAAMGRNWDWTFPFGDTPDYEPSLDLSLAAQARARGVSPAEFAYDLLLEKGGRGTLYVALGNFYEGRLDAVLDMLIHPQTVIGLGDGGAHYGAICDASYPTFMLSYWSRDRKGPQVSVADAVRSLAYVPAKTVGLNDRGLLKPGYKADINVIDHGRLTLHGTSIRHDLPAGGRRLDQGATGYDATIVSGRIIRRNDQPTDALPGRLVRGAQQIPAVQQAAA